MSHDASTAAAKNGRRRAPRGRPAAFFAYSSFYRSWIRWLEACELPTAHIAVLLDVTEDALYGFLDRPCKRTTPTPTPIRPPRKRGIGIFGLNATKVRRLRELGYSSQRIATILAVDLVAVQSFIKRIRPIRKDRLVRPRGHGEQARLKRRRPKPVPPPKPPPPAIDPCEAWRYRDDVGADGRPVRIVVAPQAVAAAEAERTAAPPVRVPNEWNGPTTMFATGEAHGSAKLTADDVREIRRLRGEGASMYRLARQYGVAENAIRSIVLFKTWKDA